MISHEQSDQPLDVKPNEAAGKRPIALAVTLILLFISMIFVVLFSSTTIGNKQQIQVDTGNLIVNSFKQLDKQLVYTEQSIDYVLNDIDTWNKDKAALLVQTGYLLENVQEELSQLLDIASSTEHEAYTTSDRDVVDHWYELQTPLFETDTSAMMKLDENFVDELLALKLSLNHLHQVVTQFNFKMEGNRNAMIRLSNGFGWIELAEQMKHILTVE